MIDALRDALRERRAVPEQVIEMGRAAFTWRTADDELAALVADSSTGAPVPAGSRADDRVDDRADDRASVRELTFALRDTTIYLQVDRHAIQGQIVPPRSGRVDVDETDGPSHAHDVDEHGWFSIAPVPAGEFRLEWRTADGWAARTAWLTL